MDDPIAGVVAALDHDFADRTLILEALTHRSFPPEGDGDTSNERLEFLGDAVLGLAIATTLYRDWDLAEGQMSRARAALVNEETLAAIGRNAGIGDALRLGRGEEITGGRDKAPILADAVEALIGAVYVDGGFDAAEAVVLRLWGDLIAERADSPGEGDHKTRLQERLARQGVAPQYEVDGTGPDHRRSFRAAVLVEGRVLGRGGGTSKKRAEQAAARAALAAMGESDA